MKNGKDVWEPVYRKLVQDNPEFGETVVDWYPSGQYELTVKTRDQQKYIYDWFSGSITPLRESEEDEEITEEEWRVKFSHKLNRKMRNVTMNRDLLSYKTGISTVTLSKYMNGKTTPSTYNIQKIAQALRCSVTELIG